MSVDVTKYLGTIRKTVEHYAQYAPWWMRQELKQQVAVILLEYDPAKLEDAESKGLVPALISRIVRNQWCSSSSEFHRKWRRGLDVDDYFWESMPEEEPEDLNDDYVARIREIIDGLKPELRDTFNDYLKWGTIEKVAYRRGEPLSTIHSRIKTVRRLVKKNLADTKSSHTFVQGEGIRTKERKPKHRNTDK